MAKPKQKGNRFEAATAKLLSERFEPKLGVPSGFIRNADSGAFYGGSNVSRMESHNLDYATFGDIVTPRDFRFVIECKHYATAPKLTGVFGGNSQWDGWISEAEHDSASSGKNWLLIMKYNNVKPLVVFEKNLTDTTFPYELYYKNSYRIVQLDYLLTMDDDFWFLAK